MIFHSLMTRLYGVTSYNLPLYSVMENTNLNILKNVGVGYLNFTSLPNITKVPDLTRGKDQRYGDDLNNEDEIREIAKNYKRKELLSLLQDDSVPILLKLQALSQMKDYDYLQHNITNGGLFDDYNFTF